MLVNLSLHFEGLELPRDHSNIKISEHLAEPTEAGTEDREGDAEEASCQ